MSPPQLGQDTTSELIDDVARSRAKEPDSPESTVKGLMLRFTIRPYLYMTLVSQTRSCKARFSSSTPNMIELTNIRTEFK